MNKQLIKEKLINLLGSKVIVYIDRVINSIHPKHKDIIYKVNYGYIKEITNNGSQLIDSLDKTLGLDVKSLLAGVLGTKVFEKVKNSSDNDCKE